MTHYERYRRMKVVGRWLVAIAIGVPLLLIVLVWLRMYEIVELIGLGEFTVLAAVFIVIGIVLWVSGWIMEGD